VAFCRVSEHCQTLNTGAPLYLSTRAGDRSLPDLGAGKESLILPLSQSCYCVWNTYRWLLSNDGDWMEKTLPKRTEFDNAEFSRRAKKVDWQKRDRETLEKVINALAEINLFSTQKKITITQIGRFIKYNCLSTDLHKLPDTNDFLIKNLNKSIKNPIDE
jgi:hypothetical protein